VRIVPLPPTAELEKLLSGLLARSVKLAADEAVPAGPCAMALYRTDEPVLEVAVLCDVALAASMAAALSVIGPAAVTEAVARGDLDESLADNFSEVMNVVSRFVSGSGRRFALAGAYAPRSAPAEIVAAARGSDERREIAAQIPGYAHGRMAFCTL
jgi:hypothetical protein